MSQDKKITDMNKGMNKDMNKDMNNTSTPSTSSTKNTSIIFLLDSSGSMQALGKEPIDSINEFIESQKTNQREIGGESTLTLYTFNEKCECVFDNVPLESVKEFTHYIPEKMTALYDAIGTAIESRIGREDEKGGEIKIDDDMQPDEEYARNGSRESGERSGVIFVVLTDGYENSSRNYTRNDITRLIAKAESEMGWKFIYLGANQDAFAVGSSLGIDRSQCMSFTTEEMEMTQLTRDLSRRISTYKKGESQSLSMITERSEGNDGSVGGEEGVGSGDEDDVESVGRVGRVGEKRGRGKGGESGGGKKRRKVMFDVEIPCAQPCSQTCSQEWLMSSPDSSSSIYEVPSLSRSMTRS